MKKLLSLALLSASVLVAPIAAHADTLNGSIPFAFVVNGTNGSGANTPLKPTNGYSSIEFNNAITFGAGQGNFSTIPFFTTITGTTSAQAGQISLFPGGPNGGTVGNPFTLTVVGYGTFTETSNVSIVASSLNGLTSSVTYYLLGSFAPVDGVFGAPGQYTPNNASVIISFTNNGGSYSGSGTLSTPAVPFTGQTPEPSSLILLGTGLIGGVGAVRRRFKA